MHDPMEEARGVNRRPHQAELGGSRLLPRRSPRLLGSGGKTGGIWGCVGHKDECGETGGDHDTQSGVHPDGFGLPPNSNKPGNTRAHGPTHHAGTARPKKTRPPQQVTQQSRGWRATSGQYASSCNKPRPAAWLQVFGRKRHVGWAKAPRRRQKQSTHHGGPGG